MINLNAANMYDVAKEAQEAGFFVGTRRYADPLYISWRGEQQK